MRDYISLALEPHHQLCRCLPCSSPHPIIEHWRFSQKYYYTLFRPLLLNHVQCVEVISYYLLDPGTTDDECTCHATLAACYQLAQSVLRFCASKNGRWAGISHDFPCTWWLSWLAVEKPLLATAGPFLSLLTQMGIERLVCLCRGPISSTVDSFQSGEAFTGRRALTIVSS